MHVTSSSSSSPWESYQRLIKNLSEEEKNLLEKEQRELTEKDTLNFVNNLNKHFISYSYDSYEARKTTLIALNALKSQSIPFSVAQLATYHILNAAIHDLNINQGFYTQIRYVDCNQELKTLNLTQPTDPGKISSPLFPTLTPYRFDETFALSVDKTEVNNTNPILKLFFDLSDIEWALFCENIKNAPESEQYYTTIPVPEIGSWSINFSRLQSLVRPFQTQKIAKEHKYGVTDELNLIIPSFTMFQTFVDVRAKTYERDSVKLVPLYQNSQNTYNDVIDGEHVPLGLYFPESDATQRYSWKNLKFKGPLNGEENIEGPLARIFNNMFCALRELEMPKEWRQASLRLAKIAKDHPNDKIAESQQAISVFFNKGELLIPQDKYECKLLKPSPILNALKMEFLVTFSISDQLNPAYIQTLKLLL